MFSWWLYDRSLFISYSLCHNMFPTGIKSWSRSLRFIFNGQLRFPFRLGLISFRGLNLCDLWMSFNWRLRSPSGLDLSSLLGRLRRGSSDSDLRLRLDSFSFFFSFLDSLERTFGESGVASLSRLGVDGECLLLERECSLGGRFYC